MSKIDGLFRGLNVTSTFSPRNLPSRGRGQSRTAHTSPRRTERHVANIFAQLGKSLVYERNSYSRFSLSMKQYEKENFLYSNSQEAQGAIDHFKEKKCWPKKLVNDLLDLRNQTRLSKEDSDLVSSWVAIAGQQAKEEGVSDSKSLETRLFFVLSVLEEQKNEHSTSTKVHRCLFMDEQQNLCDFEMISDGNVTSSKIICSEEGNEYTFCLPEKYSFVKKLPEGLDEWMVSRHAAVIAEKLFLLDRLSQES